MPIVQYTTNKDIIEERNMPTPRRMDKIEYWYKAARKAIPSIPDVNKTIWSIIQITTTLSTIIFELSDGIGNKRAVIIDRTKNF